MSTALWIVAGLFAVVIITGTVAVMVDDAITRAARTLKAREWQAKQDKVIRMERW